MRVRRALFLAALALAGSIVIPCGQAAEWDWSRSTPDAQGMSAEKLEAIRTTLAAKGTKALLVIRNDAIVLEWYAPPHSVTQVHYTASMAKAIVAGVSLAVAVSDGRIALDDPAAKYIPQWKDDPLKARILIRHLGSHTSGLEDAEDMRLPHDRLTGWKGDFWKRLNPPDDPFTLSRDRAPVQFEPGREMRYSNPGIAALTYAVTASLRGAPEQDVRTLLRERVMRPIGVPDREWNVGYGTTVKVDGLPLIGSWGGANYTARAVARVGRLMLRAGDWNGTQLIRPEAVRSVTVDAGTPGDGAMGWWSNNEGEAPGLPRDAFWGTGAGHQSVLVVPSLGLIAVRNGALLEPTEPGPRAFHEPLVRLLFEPLAKAVSATGTAAAALYPPSPVITRVDWAPKETIVRNAKGSDNWPLTWGDDDQLYTAYGDGKGFDLATTPKLSLGLARIAGGPTDFHGVNLRASTAEQTGDGAAGKKASGMLMVDGVLYLFARNASNAQLAWSNDHGAQWTWADWKVSPSFGCPTFLNFGRNYAGARDDYVYIYSHDADSAYTAADRMVLARVPKGRVRERAAYEFLQRLDSSNAPVWTNDIAARGAIFTRPGRCYRSAVTYNAGLKRYLWCQTLPGDDARFRGGFAIYDGPEPWGPWTTVYSTDEWDVGPGETSSFPTKWISDDGKTLYLVFSGDDCFSVRKATLATAP